MCPVGTSTPTVSSSPGAQGWSCCKKRTTDFSEFLSIQVTNLKPPSHGFLACCLSEEGAKVAGTPCSSCPQRHEVSEQPGEVGRLFADPLLPGWGGTELRLSRHGPGGAARGNPCGHGPCAAVGWEPGPAGRRATGSQELPGAGAASRLERAKQASGSSLLLRDAQRGSTARRSPLSLFKRRARTRRRPSQWRNSSSKDQNQLR